MKKQPISPYRQYLSILCFIVGLLCFWFAISISSSSDVSESSKNNSSNYITRNIQDIQVGDEVIAHNVLTGKTETSIVSSVFHRESDHIRYISIRDNSGIQIFSTTDTHPFWVVTDSPDYRRVARKSVYEGGITIHHSKINEINNGQYVEASMLIRGDKVKGPNGEIGVVVDSKRIDYPNKIKVYNFEVLNNHNYYVIAKPLSCIEGNIPILVHNGTGSYTITFENGNKYHGKGDYNRALNSAKRISKEHSVRYTEIDWTPAPNNRQSFIDEAQRIRNDNGVGRGVGNYNMINSPGEKFLPKVSN